MQWVQKKSQVTLVGCLEQVLPKLLTSTKKTLRTRNQTQNNVYLRRKTPNIWRAVKKTTKLICKVDIKINKRLLPDTGLSSAVRVVDALVVRSTVTAPPTGAIIKPLPLSLAVLILASKLATTVQSEFGSLIKINKQQNGRNPSIRKKIITVNHEV